MFTFGGPSNLVECGFFPCCIKEQKGKKRKQIEEGSFVLKSAGNIVINGKKINEEFVKIVMKMTSQRGNEQVVKKGYQKKQL